MEISVTGRHMDITEAITTYAHEKVEAEISVFPRVESVHVVLNIEKYRHYAEVFVQAANHLRIDGKTESDDMYVSLCPDIDVASQGNTIEEAKANLKEAIELFFETASKDEIKQRLHDEVLVTNLQVAIG